MAAKKYLKFDDTNKAKQEVAAVVTSAGAGNDGDLVALNASGVLDSTIVNSKNSSAGAGDAGKLVQLDSSGKIDNTMMPVGIGADTVTATASEAIAAGDFVNLYNSSGLKMRKADASGGVAKKADGFVLAAVSNAATGTVYLEGQNTQVSGLTIGDRLFLSGSAPGGVTATPPTTATHIAQYVGKALSATAINTEIDEPVVRA